MHGTVSDNGIHYTVETKSKNSKISKAPLIKDQERLNGTEKLFLCRKSQENFSCMHSRIKQKFKEFIKVIAYISIKKLL